MFKKQRQFNIISGQKNNFPSAISLNNIRKIQIFNKQDKRNVQSLYKLGQAKDKKLFQYSYDNRQKKNNPQDNYYSAKTQDRYKTRLMNSVSTNYNIVNMKQQHQTSKIINHETFHQKLPQIHQTNFLTSHLHAARLFAPNYQQDYDQRVKRGEFLRRKNMCQRTCSNQKTFAMKFFRVMK